MPKGMLTYDQVLDVLKSGGSVTYKGGLIVDIASMPTRLQYAGDDKEEAEAVLAQMKAEQQEQAAAIAEAEKKK